MRFNHKNGKYKEAKPLARASIIPIHIWVCVYGSSNENTWLEVTALDNRLILSLVHNLYTINYIIIYDNFPVVFCSHPLIGIFRGYVGHWVGTAQSRSH